MFHYGIEHEVAFLKANGQFLDFTNTTHAELDQVIKALPAYESDRDRLRFDRTGIMTKRWYIEGHERFDDEGNLAEYIPKGIEIRTTPQNSIEATLAELSECFRLLKEAASIFGFTPTWISHNPYQTTFEPQGPFSKYELDKLENSPEDRTEHLAMCTYGPDLNISMDGLSDDEVVDLGKKLTYYSPFIVPFSFSSPFYSGKLWDGYSVRTYIRTGDRHAVRVFISDESKLINDSPLTRIARIPVERGRIEFKAFDSCNDPKIYRALLVLLKGLILDKSLNGRSLWPDKRMHQLSAKEGFLSEEIFNVTSDIMNAVSKSLTDDSDKEALQVLMQMLLVKRLPAQDLIDDYHKLKSIEKTLENNNYDRLII
jgi:hypothetical protein